MVESLWFFLFRNSALLRQRGHRPVRRQLWDTESTL